MRQHSARWRLLLLLNVPCLAQHTRCRATVYGIWVFSSCLPSLRLSPRSFIMKLCGKTFSGRNCKGVGNPSLWKLGWLRALAKILYYPTTRHWNESAGMRSPAPRPCVRMHSIGRKTVPGWTGADLDVLQHRNAIVRLRKNLDFDCFDRQLLWQAIWTQHLLECIVCVCIVPMELTQSKKCCNHLELAM